MPSEQSGEASSQTGREVESQAETGAQVSGFQESTDTPSASVASSVQEFLTPEQLEQINPSVSSNHLAEEEEEVTMVQIKDPPKFRGEARKDDLAAYVHELSAWYHTARCQSTLRPEQLFGMILHGAFPYESPADVWFKGAAAEIRAKAMTEGAESDAYLHEIIKALEQEFRHLQGDKEQRLYALVYGKGDDVAAFLLKYEKLAREAKVGDMRAIKQLATALRMHAPRLAEKVQDAACRDESPTLAAVVKLVKTFEQQSLWLGFSSDKAESQPRKKTRKKDL